jgi:hypothetical protein
VGIGLEYFYSLTDGAVDDDQPGQRIGPPPAEHRVQGHAKKHGHGEQAIDESDVPLGF